MKKAGSVAIDNEIMYEGFLQMRRQNGDWIGAREGLPSRLGLISLILVLLTPTPGLSRKEGEIGAAPQLELERLQVEIDQRDLQLQGALEAGDGPRDLEGRGTYESLRRLHRRLQLVETDLVAGKMDAGKMDAGKMDAGKMDAVPEQVSVRLANLRRQLYNLRLAAELGVPVPPEARQDLAGSGQAGHQGNTGAISGTVRFADNGLPIAGASVRVFLTAGFWIGDVTTDAGGNYSASGLSMGQFLAIASGDGYVAQLFDGTSCLGNSLTGSCASVFGTPIPVAPGSPAEGVDFDLELEGTISGFVRGESGEGLACSVEAYAEDGRLAERASTDGLGNYFLHGLLAGAYRVSTDCADFVDEVWPDTTCLGECNPAQGRDVSVELGRVTPNIDFVLDPGGSVTGRVTWPSGEPFFQARIFAYHGFGSTFESARTDADGRYEMRGFATGSYELLLTDSGVLSMFYDGVLCSGACVAGSGDPVPVVDGEETSGIDFVVVVEGRIDGEIEDSVSGLPVAVGGQVKIWNGNGVLIDSVLVDPISSPGVFESASLAHGTYFLTAVDFPGYQNLLYQALPCIPGPCLPFLGTPVAVQVDTVSEVLLALRPEPSLRGVVRERDGGLPLAGVSVRLYDDMGAEVASRTTSTDGSYAFDGLAAGTYFLLAEGAGIWVPELYDGMPCLDLGCDPTEGTSIGLGFATPLREIDFTLAPLGFFGDDFESGGLEAWALAQGADGSW